MIICAALKDRNTNAIFSGVRHADIYEMLHNLDYKIDAIEGFVDEENTFYDRIEAYDYVVEHHQLPRTVLEMTASEARALVKESVVCKEMSLFNDIDNKIREEATQGNVTCMFSITNFGKNQLTNICTHYRNLGFAASFHISKSYNKLGDYIEVGNIYLSWGE